MTEKSINQEKQQKMNRSLVLQLLRQQGLASRADIAKLSGLQRATISNIVRELMDMGLVIEQGLLCNERGRRSIGICLDGAHVGVVGVMITREYFGVSLIGISGKVHKTQYFQLNEQDSVYESVRKLKREIKYMIAAHTKFRVLAVGFAVPGPYRIEGDEMIFITNLRGWDGIPIRSLLQEGLSVPVFIENDANAGVLAQFWKYEKDLFKKDLVYIVAGQGIGCGMISGGMMLKGAIGIAGEIGHTTIDCHGPRCACGNYGCLELYASALALKRNLKARLDAGEESVLSKHGKPAHLADEAIRQALEQKDPLVCEEFQKTCEYLAIGLVNLINQMDPELVILGDTLAEIGGTQMLELVRRKVESCVRPIIWENLRIELDTLPENPILIGAGAVAAQHIFENPAAFI